MFMYEVPLSHQVLSRLKLFFSEQTGSAISSFAAAGAYMGYDYYLYQNTNALKFTLVYALLCISRIIFSRYFFKYAKVMSASKLLQVEKKYSLLVGSCGLVFALFYSFHFPVEFEQQSFLAIICAGLGAGAVASCFASFPSFICFVTPIFLTLPYFLLSSNNLMTIIIGALSVVFFMFIIKLNLKMSKMIRHTHELQMDLMESSRLAIHGEITSGIAHEINNPLTIVLGHVQRLTSLDETKRSDWSIIGPSILKIQDASVRAADIIKALRDITRSTSDHEFTQKKILLRDVLEQALTHCEERIKNFSGTITISNSFPEALVRINEVQIVQIIVNFVTNAIDAMESSENKKQRIKITISKDAENFLLKVIDTGAGVPANIRHKILQPFFTTKKNGKGSGLGLSLCKRFAKFNGGTIYLDDKAKLNTFVLSLPCFFDKEESESPSQAA